MLAGHCGGWVEGVAPANNGTAREVLASGEINAIGGCDDAIHCHCVL